MTRDAGLAVWALNSGCRSLRSAPSRVRKSATKRLEDIGMTQREIGATLGVTQQTVSNDLHDKNLSERSTPTVIEMCPHQPRVPASNGTGT